MPLSLTSSFQARLRLDDLIGVVLAEGDAPALGARACGRSPWLNSTQRIDDVVVLVLLEGEVLAAVLGREAAEAGGAQRLQAERVQALDRLDLEQRVAGQDEQAVVLDVVELGPAVLPADLGAGIVERDAGERQLDLLLLPLPAACRGRR